MLPGGALQTATVGGLPATRKATLWKIETR